MKTSLYRFYDSDGVLLYVGMSKDPFVRFGQHISARGDAMELPALAVSRIIGTGAHILEAA